MLCSTIREFRVVQSHLRTQQLCLRIRARASPTLYVPSSFEHDFACSTVHYRGSRTYRRESLPRCLAPLLFTGTTHYLATDGGPRTILYSVCFPRTRGSPLRLLRLSLVASVNSFIYDLMCTIRAYLPLPVWHATEAHPRVGYAEQEEEGWWRRVVFSANRVNSGVLSPASA